MFGRWRKKPDVVAAPVASAPKDRYSPIVVEIERKELFECGFEFCGAPIIEAFALSDIALALDDEREWPADAGSNDDGLRQCLWVDGEYIVEEIGHDVEFELADGSLNALSALGWDLLMALRARFHDPDDPDRNWHIAGVDGGFEFVLCRPDQFDSLPGEPRQDFERPVDLTGAREIRRGHLD